jgi:hypothetical protein
MRVRDEEHLKLFDPEKRYARERASWLNRDQFHIVQGSAFRRSWDAFDFDAIASAEVDGSDEAASR